MNKAQQKYSKANRRAKTLRRQMGFAEQRAWDTLRKLEGLPGRFRRQCPIGPYIADFVCHAARLIVEIDGGVHRLAEVQARDAARQAWFEAQGFAVVRIASELAADPDALAARVRETSQ